MQFSQKIDGLTLRQKKKITGLLELLQLYKQNSLEKFFIFAIYQNYTLDLIYGCDFLLSPNRLRMMKMHFIVGSVHLKASKTFTIPDAIKFNITVSLIFSNFQVLDAMSFVS